MRYLLLFLLLALHASVFGYSSNGQKNDVQKVLISVKSDLNACSFIDFLYQGQYFDTETELAYNRFRYYSPESGTYLSQDPIGLAGNNPNFYAYTHDLNAWIDPLGLTGLNEGGQSVYGLYDAGASEPYYIGISNDPDVRATQHMETGRLTDAGEMRVLHSDLTYAQSRGYEQALIEKHGTKTGIIGEPISSTNRGNKINSFDKTRTDVRGKAFKAEYDKVKGC